MGQGQPDHWLQVELTEAEAVRPANKLDLICAHRHADQSQQFHDSIEPLPAQGVDTGPLGEDVQPGRQDLDLDTQVARLQPLLFHFILFFKLLQQFLPRRDLLLFQFDQQEGPANL